MKLLIIFICFLMAMPVFGEKLTTFFKIFEPKFIKVGDNVFCINEDRVVFLFDLNNFKLIKQFGRKGEGPGEFASSLKINLLKDKIMIESQGKLSFYSLKGDLIKEIPLLPKNWELKILENHYIASSSVLNNDVYHITAKILDTDFNELKTFYRDEAMYPRKKQKTILASTWDYDVSEKKCFIVGSNKFKIDVFNKGGDLLYTISPGYERLKITQEYIDARLNRIKRLRGTNEYLKMKKKYRFAEFYPAIRDLIVDNGHVYAITYLRKNKKSEVFIFNLEGQLIKKIFLPIHFDEDGLYPSPYDIKSNYLYQLMDNEGEDILELHRFSILK